MDNLRHMQPLHLRRAAESTQTQRFSYELPDYINSAKSRKSRVVAGPNIHGFSAHSWCRDPTFRWNTPQLLRNDCATQRYTENPLLFRAVHGFCLLAIFHNRNDNAIPCLQRLESFNIGEHPCSTPGWALDDLQPGSPTVCATADSHLERKPTAKLMHTAAPAGSTSLRS